MSALPPKADITNNAVSYWHAVSYRFCSRFLRALFQFSKRAAGEAAKFGRSGVELLGVVGAARLECDEPAAEAGELIRRQLGNNFGDFFDFHVAQYSTAAKSTRFACCFQFSSLSVFSLSIALTHFSIA